MRNELSEQEWTAFWRLCQTSRVAFGKQMIIGSRAANSNFARRVGVELEQSKYRSHLRNSVRLPPLSTGPRTLVGLATSHSQQPK